MIIIGMRYFGVFLDMNKIIKRNWKKSNGCPSLDGHPLKFDQVEKT